MLVSPLPVVVQVVGADERWRQRRKGDGTREKGQRRRGQEKSVEERKQEKEESRQGEGREKRKGGRGEGIDENPLFSMPVK